MIALLSGGIDPVLGLIVHWPIFKPTSYLAPLPPFLAYFLTYFVSFLPAFLESAATGAVILLAAYNFACLSFYAFAIISFLNSSLAKSKIE
jgi:hypothetical protein